MTQDDVLFGYRLQTDAPVPRSSSVPNDIDPANLAGTASNGYRELLTWPGEQLFF